MYGEGQTFEHYNLHRQCPQAPVVPIHGSGRSIQELYLGQIRDWCGDACQSKHNEENDIFALDKTYAVLKH